MLDNSVLSHKPIPCSGVLVSPFWQQHDAMLLVLVAEGKSSGEVAAAMGVSRNAVIGRARRIGAAWARAAYGGRGRRTKQMSKPTHEWDFPPAGRCVFPHGDPGRPGFGFCGKPVHDLERSYCPECRRLAYRPVATTEAASARWTEQRKTEQAIRMRRQWEAAE